MINYRVSPKVNSLKNNEKVYTAMLVSSETTSEEWFYEQLAKKTRISKSDSLRLLYEVREVLLQGFQDNKIVHVPYLGNFRLTAHSKTVKNPKAFKPDNIKELKIQFNPDKSIKKEVKNFPLKKVK